MKLKDYLILLLPVAAIALIVLIPAIPSRIPMQFSTDGTVNWYLPKWLFPIVGIIPFLVYIKYKNKKNK